MFALRRIARLYPFSSPRSLFLSSLGAIYVAAFTSLFLQLPGLLSEDGLQPAAATWRRLRSGGASAFAELPCLLWLLPEDAPAELLDLAVEALVAAGAVLGALVAAGLHHGSLFAGCFLCHLSLFQVGGTFLSFQWDIFLLETGAAAILYAPWRSATSRARASCAHPMTHVLRAQWVKFMLCSGAVKVTARCPTWQQLTALEYHFASTCLPTYEAWYHHSLPPILLRAAVAFMFLCELVAPWLLLAPVTAVRRVGVVVQLALQAAIAATGNYNWFNLHTAALLLPAWDRDVSLAAPSRRPPPSLARAGLALLAPMRAWERAWATWLGRAAATAAALAGLGLAAAALFPLRYTPDPAAGGPMRAAWAALSRPDALALESRLDEDFVRRLLAAGVQRATVLYLYSMVVLSAVGYALAPDEEPCGPAPPPPPPPSVELTARVSANDGKV